MDAPASTPLLKTVLRTHVSISDRSLYAIVNPIHFNESF